MLAFKIIFCYSCISYLDVSHLTQFLYLCLKQKLTSDDLRSVFVTETKKNKTFLFIVIVLLIYFSFKMIIWHLIFHLHPPKNSHITKSIFFHILIFSPRHLQNITFQFVFSTLVNFSRCDLFSADPCGHLRQHQLLHVRMNLLCTDKSLCGLLEAASESQIELHAHFSATKGSHH